MLRTLARFAKSPVLRGPSSRGPGFLSRDSKSKLAKIKSAPGLYDTAATPLLATLPKTPGITSYVTLLPDKAKLFRDGNPIVYAEAVASVHGHPKAGDEVFVIDHLSVLVGRGFYNQFSRFRVRLTALSREKEVSLPLVEVLKTRFNQALLVRESIALSAFSSSSVSSPSEEAFRLVNSEGDRLGGLVVDVLGNTGA